MNNLPNVSSSPKVAEQIVVKDIVGNCNGNVTNSNVGNGPKVAHTSSGSKPLNGSSGFKSAIPKPSSKTKVGCQNVSAPVSSDSEPDFKKPRTVSGGARVQIPCWERSFSFPSPFCWYP